MGVKVGFPNIVVKYQHSLFLALDVLILCVVLLWFLILLLLLLHWCCLYISVEALEKYW